MEYCPGCKAELPQNADVCVICNYEIQKSKSEWILIGSIHDSISSDYAKETLKSYNIPAVIISKSGMFGTAGLPLTNFHNAGKGLFDVSVPEDFAVEAIDILNMILGESWTKKD